MDIEEQEVRVIGGNVGEENELQPSQSQHKKQKKSHIGQVEPQGVVAGTRSIQVAAEADNRQQKGKLCFNITNYC
jgi:hypothetical protein